MIKKKKKKRKRKDKIIRTQSRATDLSNIIFQDVKKTNKEIHSLTMRLG